MVFFIGGVQPRTVDLDESPRMCRGCGLYQARLKRIDHYISIFFIPIFPVKKGTPYIECDRCGNVSSETGEELLHLTPQSGFKNCPNCGKSVEIKFKYCPFCGIPL